MIAKPVWNFQSKNWATADNKKLLHIGCGEINAPEFINIDARPYKHIHIVSKNLFNLWRIPDNSVNFIYMCHVLEHVPRAKTLNVLKEMYRVIKPSGILRISVPDFDKILTIYAANNNSVSSITGPLMGGQEYPENFHYNVFNQDYLENIFYQAGFENINQWDPLNCSYHDFEDWASKQINFANSDYEISLNMEASKK